MVVIAILLTAMISGFFLLAFGLLALWMAGSRVPLAIRTPVFLLATVPFGGALAIAAFDGAWVAYAILLAGSLVCFSTMDRGLVWLGAVLAVIASALLVSRLAIGRVEVAAIGWTAITCAVLATILSSIRWLGFHWAELVDGRFSEESERVTGRTIDQWIRHFDGLGAKDWKYAEIMAHLRQHGVTYQDQKTITEVYERAIGRRPLGRSITGQARALAEPLRLTVPSHWLPIDSARFGTAQLMQWSFAAACCFAFLRLVWPLPVDADLVTLGLALTIGQSIVTMAVVVSTMSVRISPRVRLIAIPVIALVAVSFQQLARFYPGQREAFMLVVITTAGYAAWLWIAMMIFRNRGYRLLRFGVQRG